MWSMNTLSYPKNPRETRAFAHAARNRANNNPTDNNVRDALAYDRMLERGPKKSRDMGCTALKPSHEEVVKEANRLDLVGWVDWGAGEVGERFENFGGGIVPRGLAERATEEIERSRNQESKESIYILDILEEKLRLLELLASVYSQNGEEARDKQSGVFLGAVIAEKGRLRSLISGNSERVSFTNRDLIFESMKANGWSAGSKEDKEPVGQLGIIEIDDLVDRSRDALRVFFGSEKGEKVVPPEERPITAVRRAIIDARRKQKQD